MSLRAKSLFDVVGGYVNKIIPENDDMKVLLLDDTTTHVISMALTQAELLERQVFLVDHIENAPQRNAMKLMHCVIFIRPENASVDAACAELERAKYKSYSIIFCSATCPEHLDRLAYADTENLVENVREVFCDFCAVNKDAFLIESTPSSTLFGASPDSMRLAEGIATVMAAHRCVPIIRYEGHSEAASQLATDLADILRHDAELYNFPPQDTVLLILDRRSDPLTPLMTPWTYQAMLHEHIGVKYNVVDLPPSSSPAPSSSREAAEEQARANGSTEDGNGTQRFVVSSKDDQLFKDNMYLQWGEVCVNFKAAVDRCKEAVSVDRNAVSVDDLKMLLQSVPQNRSMTMTATKHVSLASKMADIIKSLNLLEVSRLEQEMFAKANASEHWNGLMGFANRCNADPHQILRLCLLYNLRYENGSDISKTKAILDQMGSAGESSMYEKLRQLRQFYGERNSTERLYPETNLMKSMIRTLKPGDAKNAYAQHEPLLKKIVFELLTGKLNENTYRLSASSRKQFASTQRIKNVWIFICGGYTFTEAAFVHSLGTGAVQWEGPGSEAVNGKAIKSLIGGDKVLNSKQFLESISGQ